MADLRPFKAYRPAQKKVDRIAALPYDVYNRQEAREVVEKNPESFLAIDRPETFFEPEHDMYAPDVYERAANELKDRINKGDFIQDEDNCYYIYELTFRGRSQTGIVALSSIDDYLSGVIKKHENTREDKEKTG